MLSYTAVRCAAQGVLAANIFDWGAKACVDLYQNATILEMYREVGAADHDVFWAAMCDSPDMLKLTFKATASSHADGYPWLLPRVRPGAYQAEQPTMAS
jgi:hypothetical protein